MQNTFKQYMIDNYTHNELAEIAQHGCESGCASGMIYYSETVVLFDQYRDDLFEIMQEYQDWVEDECLPEYVRQNAETFEKFANAVVWLCAEIVAYDLTQGEYENKSEVA